MVKENPNSKPEHWLFGDVYHCKDAFGNKVRANYNANNRSFDDTWCEDLEHTLLSGQWAGPLTIPGETVNGETIRISRYGRVLSGQHQLTAVWRADQKLQKLRAAGAVDKYPFWKDKVPFPLPGVVLETLVVVGLSEDPRVLMTIDYCKPRTLADVFYTSPLFRTKSGSERKELSRMLSAATDLLWTRTDTKGYKTHPEAVAFVERHKRLLKCVEHIFAENDPAGRHISKLGLSPGQCAAMYYLMACSGDETDGDAYRNGFPPSETVTDAEGKHVLDWSLWDKARDFWVEFAGSQEFLPVRTALTMLMVSTPDSEENQGMGGKAPEKLAIISKAWERYKDHPSNAGPAFDAEDLVDGGILDLAYSNTGPPDKDGFTHILPDGRITLIDLADFGGIDCPEAVALGQRSRTDRTASPSPPTPTKEEIEKATEEALRRRSVQK
jgi:hypothetical protein